ncbi:hypothetical protein BDN72DRAFT_899179 [Pluteus cervinus]|uniref:Uncharacterized protein n=1 Tax=Pluteus cervinus TaxID=181527 RepID=A0ACD3ANQ6_9AGAR|nr:hypothetical protein BDN72DRAFT_899179 [Pluteus cervinus]
MPGREFLGKGWGSAPYLDRTQASVRFVFVLLGCPNLQAVDVEPTRLRPSLRDTPMSSNFNFPPELEHEVFLCALEREVTEPVNLLLVAKYVHDWLIPHIYRTLVIQLRVYPPNSTPTTLKAQGHRTQHLLIKITHLSTDLAQFMQLTVYSDLQDDPDDADLDYEIPRDAITFFSRITHLQITTPIRNVEVEVHLLRYLKSLTHLCVPLSVTSVVIQDLVDMSKTVEVVVLLTVPERTYFEQDVIEVASEVGVKTDLVESVRERIVLIVCWQPVVSWENGVRGGEDMWTLADRVIKERRRAAA